MDKIICVVGESGSGKTTIAKALEKEGYNMIHSYTTREPREENEWGHTFIATDDTEKYIGNMIDYKQLYGAEYFAIKQQYKNKGTSIYVIDPSGAKQVKENVKDAEIVVVYLKCDGNERWRRLWQRKGNMITRELYVNSHQEIENRLSKDKEYFKLIKCDYCIDANGTIEETLSLVKQVIE